MEREGQGGWRAGEGRGRGEGVLILHHTIPHMHTPHTHTPVGAPCSVDPCHLTPTCRWPRSPPLLEPSEHIWCHVQHLVLMPSPAFTEHCGCRDTSVSSRVLQQDRQHQPPWKGDTHVDTSGAWAHTTPCEQGRGQTQQTQGSSEDRQTQLPV